MHRPYKFTLPPDPLIPPPPPLMPPTPPKNLSFNIVEVQHAAPLHEFSGHFWNF